MLKKDVSLIWISYLVLLIYNVFSLSCAFENALSVDFHKFYQDNFGTLFLLELILVASIFVNIILNYDTYKEKKNFSHIIITALLVIAFFIKIIFYFMGVFKVV